jgi:uncharacterized protein (UPF0332 family)
MCRGVLTVTPQDLLQLAERLKAESIEVAWRAAASRAYYASFHACLAIANVRGFTRPSSTGGIHEALIRFLEIYPGRDSSEVNKVRSLGRQMRLGRRIRTQADYDIHVEFPSARASESSSLSAKILAQIKRL